MTSFYVFVIFQLCISTVKAWPEIGFNAKITSDVNRGVSWNKVSGWVPVIPTLSGFYIFDANLISGTDVSIPISGMYFVAVSLPCKGLESGSYKGALVINGETESEKLGLLSEISNTPGNRTLSFSGIISLRSSESIAVYTYSDSDTDWSITKATFTYHFLGKLGSTPGFHGQLESDQILSEANKKVALEPWRITSRAKLFRSKAGFISKTGTFMAICTGLHLVAANIIIDAAAGTHQFIVELEGNRTTAATVKTTKQSRFTMNSYITLAMKSESVVRIYLTSTASNVQVKVQSSWSMAFMGDTNVNFREFSNQIAQDVSGSGFQWKTIDGLLSNSKINGQFYQPNNLNLFERRRFVGTSRTDLYYVMINLEIEGNSEEIEVMTAVNAPEKDQFGGEGIYGILTKSANQSASLSLAGIFHLKINQHISLLVKASDGKTFNVKKHSTVSIVRTRYILSGFTARISQDVPVQKTGWGELKTPWADDASSRGMYTFGKDFNTLNGKFTASHTGVHVVAALITFKNADSSIIAINVAINGQYGETNGLYATNGAPSSLNTLHVYGSLFLRAGQFVSIYYYSATDSDYQIAIDSSFSVTYIGPAWAIHGFHAILNKTLEFNSAGSKFVLKDNWVTQKSNTKSLFNNDDSLSLGKYKSSEDAIYLVSANIHVYNISQTASSDYTLYIVVNDDLKNDLLTAIQPTFPTSTFGRDFATISITAPVRIKASQHVSLYFLSATDTYYRLGEGSDFSVTKWSLSNSPRTFGFLAATFSTISVSNKKNIAVGLNTPKTDEGEGTGLFYLGPKFLDPNINIPDYRTPEAGIYFITGSFSIGNGAARFSLEAQIDTITIPLKSVQQSPKGIKHSLSVSAALYATAGQRIRIAVKGNLDDYNVLAGSYFGLIMLQRDETNPGFSSDKTNLTYGITQERKSIKEWGGTSKPGLHVSNEGFFSVPGTYTTQVGGVYVASFNSILKGVPSDQTELRLYGNNSLSLGVSSFGATRTVMSARLVYLPKQTTVKFTLESRSSFDSSDFSAGSSLYFFERKKHITALSDTLSSDQNVGTAWTAFTSWNNDTGSFTSNVNGETDEFTSLSGGKYLVMFSGVVKQVSNTAELAVFIDSTQYLTGITQGGTDMQGIVITGAVSLSPGQRISFKARGVGGSFELQSNTTRSVLLVNKITTSGTGLSAKLETETTFQPGISVLSQWNSSQDSSFATGVNLDAGGLIIVHRGGVYHISANIIIENTGSNSIFEVYVKVDTESVSPMNLRAEQQIPSSGINTLSISSSIYLQRFSSVRIFVKSSVPYNVKKPSLFSLILIDDNVGPSICDDSNLHVQKFEKTFIRISIDKTVNLTCNVLGFYPVIYSWYKNNTVISGAVSKVLTISPTILNDTGVYRCMVRYQNLNTTTNTVTVEVYDPTPRAVPMHGYSLTLSEDTRINFNVQPFLVSAIKFAPGKALVKLVIAGGDPFNHFNFSSPSRSIVTLKTNAKLDYENIPFYSLRITAINIDELDARNSTITVNITILDVNDNLPVISLETYSISIPENTTVGSSIGRVNATDKDKGPQAKMRYSFVGTNALPWFSINETTGVIYVRSELDRESKDRHVLAVKASDGDFSDVAEVVINVLDVNDNRPVFAPLEYKFSVVENFPILGSLIQVQASDIDLYDNANFTFSFVNQAPSTFSLNSRTGVLTLAKQLDAETRRFYEFNVTAIDNGFPSLTSSPTARIAITVIDVNDRAPAFELSLYTKRIREDTPVNTPVLNISATDNDTTSQNHNLRYRINQPHALEYFQINAMTGQITVKKELDYEVTQVFNFTVTASDTGNVSIARTTNVIIYIENINDERPVIFPTTYNITISEYTPVGASIMQLNATDPDGKLTPLTFRQLSGNNSDFWINSDTGDIIVMRILDRESTSSYSLNVTVFDGARMASEFTTVIINISDENDNRPVFGLSSYSVRKMETTPVGTSILQINATDRDLGMNQDLVYSIINTGQNPSSSMFSIHNSTGVIRLERPLDYEVKREHQFVVMVSDKGKIPLRNVITVKVTVLDVNDNKPYFEKQIHNVSILESAPLGTLITQVTALDNDTSQQSLSYSILQGNDAFKFAIDNLGFLKVVGKLDYEIQQTYRLEVQASDGALVTSPNANVTINILEVNDNRPMFSQSYYRVILSEASKVGTVILKVNASDADRGNPTSTIRYTSLENTTDFNVDEISGNITVVRPLDYETKQSYSLVVTAQDMGSPHLTGRAMVDIIIEDVNDNAPVFSQNVYNITITEFTPILSSVLRIYATDNDTELNGMVTYIIVNNGTNNGTFLVDGKTGAITVAKALDFERQTSYFFNVRAYDGGNPMLTSNATVWIYIADGNDNQAIFTRDRYDKTIPENTPRQTFITTVYALDSDGTYPNRKLQYYVVPSKDSDNFTVTTTGNISSNALYDYETIKRYSFEVEARDTATSQLRGRTLVVIHISDINDNVPVLDKANYTLNITEGTLVGSHVIALIASDSDSGRNAKIKFTITSITPAADFTIGPDDGVIRVASRLNYVTRPYYQISVNVSDQGSPQLSTLAYISIRILPASFDGLTFSSNLYEFYIFENTLMNPVGSVKASDMGRYISRFIIYEISSSPVGLAGGFSINGSTGNITMNRTFNYEYRRRWDLGVKASNERGSITYTHVIIHIVDVNEQPYFLHHASNGHYYFNITERAIIDKVVFSVSATDRDYGLNGELVFSIQSGKNSSFFRIDNTGHVYNRRPIDFESSSYLEFDLTVTDKGQVPLSANTTVNVYIFDVNDNVPTFVPSSPILVTIDENTSLGSHIVKLNTTDYDGTSPNNIVRYNITPSGFLNVSETGIVSVASNLDYESRQDLTCLLIAYDLGTPSLHSTNHLVLNIRNLNDNFPYFKMTYYNISIIETAHIGTEIIRLKAYDNDLEAFGNIVNYTIQSGGDGKFTIDSDGKISLAKTLEFSTTSRYTLLITATDGGSRTSPVPANVTINVIYSSRLQPYFVLSAYYVTLPENNRPGLTLVTVIANSTEMIHGPFVYSLIPSNDSANFSINNKTGDISSKISFDYEIKRHYALHVEALDFYNGKTVRTLVVITVTDVNDNVPLIGNQNRIYNISEAALIGSTIGYLTASDKDDGMNGQFYFRLIGGDGNGTFLVNQDGTITLDSAISSSIKSNYTLLIRVTDRGVPSLQSNATVIFNIITANVLSKNIPKFNPKSYTRYVNENTTVVSLLQVSANHSSPISSSTLIFSIEGSSSETSPFTIDSASGNISLVIPLDYEQKNEYNFLAVVVNEVGRRDIATVRVIVLDINDNRPRFSPVNYNTVISELTPVGLSVIQLTTVDADTPAVNKGLNFAITSGNDKGFFGVTSKGYIVVNKILDFEDLSSNVVTLLVTVAEGSFLAASTATVRIGITEENDNNPLFMQNSYNFEIFENRTVGFVVGSIFANDSDRGSQNNMIFYSLETNFTNFNISTEGGYGIIRLAQRLDYEKQRSYDIVAVATDRGSPYLLNTTLIHIRVIDSNDNYPVFEYLSYRTSISEGTGTETKIIKLRATDKDSGMAGVIKYGIEDATNTFTVDDRSGIITLRKKIDYESVTQYVFQATATDGYGLQSNVTVTISIINVNDNQPIFIQSIYDFDVNENQTAPNLLGTVQANDTDRIGNSIIYSIVPNMDSGNFSINSKGEINTQIILDYESIRRYTFLVNATDSGSPNLNGYAQVIVNVLDINDNTPLITGSYHVRNISVLSALGTIAISLHASDLDSGINGRFTWSIISGNSPKLFAIDNNGDIRVLRKLTANVTHTLTVQVKDLGSPSRSSTATVVINVYSIPVNRPVFSKSHYVVTVSENIELNTAIVHLLLTSTIPSQYSPTTLTFHQSTRFPEFSVSNKTNNITIASPLNYERQKRYDLTVIAKNNEQYTATATVIVYVTNVNERPPYFLRLLYNVTISELAFLRYRVVQLQGNDNDTGITGLTYNILKGNEDNNFILEGRNILVHQKPFAKRLYIMNASVSDPGGLKGYATVIVNIKPANPPKFSNAVYVREVREDILIQTNILNVSAGLPTRGITYTIHGSDARGTFSVNQATGAIVNLVTLDYEVKKQYIFTVMARVSTPIPLTTVASVVINVVNVHDVIPRFSLENYRFNISENHPVNNSILSTLVVVNRDVSSGLQFKIKNGDPGNNFGITKYGDLFLRKQLVYDTQKQYNFQVEVNDGKFTATTNVSIDVFETPKCNPIFELPLYYIKIAETTSMNTLLFTIRLKHLTSGVVFSMIGGESSSFQLNPSSGEIRTNDNFNYDRKTTYIFRVQGKIQDRSAYAAVLVEIYDVDNIKPFLQTNNYTRVLYESAPIGSQVVYVNATKMDTIPKKLRYNILAGNSDSLFSINDAGSIKLVGSLDYEKRRRHDITVEVADSQQSVLAYVTVNVLDIQETISCNACPTAAPCPSCTPGLKNKFTKPLYEATIQENAQASSFVTQVRLNIGAGAIFSIIETAKQSIFNIDSVTGRITLKSMLDYETTRFHIFTVAASGLSCLNLSTTVLVHVTNVNDGCPRASQASQTTRLQMPVDQDTIVAVLDILDTDQTDRSHSLSISQGDTSKFKIDSKGIIRTKLSINQNKNLTYPLVISIQEGSSCTHTASVTVFLTALPEKIICPSVSTPQSISCTPAPPCPSASSTPCPTPAPCPSITPAMSLCPTPAPPCPSASSTPCPTPAPCPSITPAMSLCPTPAPCPTTTVTQSAVSCMVCPTPTSCPSVSKYLFSSALYNKTYKENTPVGTSLLTVSVGGSSVFYSIVENKAKWFFKMDNGTGIITLKEKLDYETQKQHVFTVMATFPSSVSTKATVIIFVDDVDDSTPIIAAIKAPVSISEGANPGNILTCLSVTDTDTSTPLRYRITSGNPGQAFNITNTGQIIVNRKLNNELRGSYNLTVEVSDGSHTTTMVIPVKLSGTNDNVPIFPNTTYVGSVPENAAVNTPILTVKASDADKGSKVRYSISDAEARKYFKIDQVTGSISLNKSVDHETVKTFSFTVTAVDDGGFTTSVPVNIKVGNVNDNHPVFVTQPHTTKVNEFAKYITTVEANDADNDVLTYSIANGNTNNIFQINNKGVITVSKILADYTQNQYSLTIKAKDPANKSATVNVTITVERITASQAGCNYFGTQGFQTLSVKENATVGSVLYTPSGTSSRPVTFSIHNTEARSFFEISNTTGQIKLKSTLDYEKKKSLVVVVKVNDPVTSISSFSYLIVNVQNIDDNEITFKTSSFSSSVSEVASPGTVVATITAEDKDSTTPLSYSITEGNTEGIFAINSATGVITLNKTLDYETKSVHNLTVCATDNLGRRKCTFVIVKAKNSNDNPPTFSQSSFNGKVTSTTKVGDVLVTATASDADGGTLSYGLVGTRANEYFAVSSSGVVTLKKNIPSTLLPITFDICATDQGPPTITSCRPITISGGSVAVNINNHSPVFLQNVYGAAVAPEATLNSNVLQVLARDNDTGAAGYIKYSITNGNSQGFFRILEDDGRIVVNKLLGTANQTKLFELTIEARDLGSPARKTTAKALIGLILRNTLNHTFTAIRNNEMDVSISKAAFLVSKVLYYHILVQKYSSTPSQTNENQEPVSWYYVHFNDGTYGFYPYVAGRVDQTTTKRKRRQVLENNDEYIRYTIGKEDCISKSGRTDICNGPVTPSTQYRFALRAFYVDGVPVTSSWSAPSRPTASRSSANTGSAGGIYMVEGYWFFGLAVLGALFVLAVLTIAVLLCFKRRYLPLYHIAYSNPVYNVEEDQNDGPKNVYVQKTEFTDLNDYRSLNTIRMKQQEEYEEKVRETKQSSFVFVEPEDAISSVPKPNNYETISADLNFDEEDPQWNSLDISLKVDPSGKLDPVVTKRTHPKITREGSGSSVSSGEEAKESKHSGSYQSSYYSEHNEYELVSGADFNKPGDVVVYQYQEGDATTMTTITTTTKVVSTDDDPMVYTEEENATNL